MCLPVAAEEGQVFMLQSGNQPLAFQALASELRTSKTKKGAHLLEHVSGIALVTLFSCSLSNLLCQMESCEVLRSATASQMVCYHCS